MSENLKVVQMVVINPGETAANGEFTFQLQPRFNASRTVQFELQPQDAESLHKALGAYFRNLKKTKE